MKRYNTQNNENKQKDQNDMMKEVKENIESDLIYKFARSGKLIKCNSSLDGVIVGTILSLDFDPEGEGKVTNIIMMEDNTEDVYDIEVQDINSIGYYGEE